VNLALVLGWIVLEKFCAQNFEKKNVVDKRVYKQLPSFLNWDQAKCYVGEI
jgi:hypothetical protein